MSKEYSKAEYKALRAAAKSDRVNFYTIDLSDFGYDYNAISIAFTPMTDLPDNRMLAVSLSYCALEDEFRPKHGKFQALNKIYNEDFVQLPLGQYFRDWGAKETRDLLLNTFTL